MLQALLWDVDGTLAETERDGHLVAFNQAFSELAVPWRWDDAQYARLLRVAGGRERLLHDMRGREQAPESEPERIALAERIHRRKNQIYAGIVGAGRVPLRPGVLPLFEDCARQGVRMGIATTTTEANVEALMSGHLGSAWRSRFATVVCAEQAPLKKPDPQVYRRALQELALEPEAALAIEDSPAGVQAARAAGVAVIVARSVYFGEATLQGASAVGPSLAQLAGWRPEAGPAASGRIELGQLQRWMQRRDG
jgi:HAD superfamily hydrolase (TIGR01509 family)